MQKIVLILILVIIVMLVVVPVALQLAGFEIFETGTGTRSVGTPEKILLRSVNGGNAWNSASVSEDTGMSFPSTITAIITNPFRPNDLYMGTIGSGLWKSMNLGESWHNVADVRGVLHQNTNVNTIAISPSNTDIMYLGVFQDGRGRVLRSEDGGREFREIYAASIEGTGVFDITIDPRAPNAVTLATGQGGLIETNDGGVTWIVKQWFGEALAGLIVNPLDLKERYLLTAGGIIFKTINGGDRWEEVDPTASRGDLGIQWPPPVFGGSPFGGFSSPSPRTFVMDPQNPRVLYVASHEGLLQSTSSGLVWRRMNLLIPPERLPIDAVAVHPFNANIIFASADMQLHRTDDGGTSWRMKELAIKGRVRSLIIHPVRPEIMFAIIGK